MASSSYQNSFLTGENDAEFHPRVNNTRKAILGVGLFAILSVAAVMTLQSKLPTSPLTPSTAMGTSSNILSKLNTNLEAQSIAQWQGSESQESSWAKFGKPPQLKSLPSAEWKECSAYTADEIAQIDEYAAYWAKRLRMDTTLTDHLDYMTKEHSSKSSTGKAKKSNDQFGCTYYSMGLSGPFNGIKDTNSVEWNTLVGKRMLRGSERNESSSDGRLLDNIDLEEVDGEPMEGVGKGKKNSDPTASPVSAPMASPVSAPATSTVPAPTTSTVPAPTAIPTVDGSTACTNDAENLYWACDWDWDTSLTIVSTSNLYFALNADAGLEFVSDFANCNIGYDISGSAWMSVSYTYTIWWKSYTLAYDIDIWSGGSSWSSVDAITLSFSYSVFTLGVDFYNYHYLLTGNACCFKYWLMSYRPGFDIYVYSDEYSFDGGILTLNIPILDNADVC